MLHREDTTRCLLAANSGARFPGALGELVHQRLRRKLRAVGEVGQFSYG